MHPGEPDDVITQMDDHDNDKNNEKTSEKTTWPKIDSAYIVIALLIVLVVIVLVILLIMCRRKRKRRSNPESHSFGNLDRNFRCESVVTSQLDSGIHSRCSHTCTQMCPGCQYQPCLSSQVYYSCGHANSHGANRSYFETENRCAPKTTANNLSSSYDVKPDYPESENNEDLEENVPISVPNQELFENIPPELLIISPRSETIMVQNKEVVYISRRVTEKGDNLVLDKMGISLFVPPGAVKKNEEKTIVLVLNWDLGDNPTMTEKQALVAPVVYVGPHDLKLEKPCTLSFKHCSFDPRHITVMKSETELIDSKDWVEHCSGTEISGACVLKPDECQIQIDSFTLYTCLQSPIGPEDSRKWLQVAAFSSPLKSSITHQQVRLYFLNKTPCALQWAIQNEAKFGGQLMGPEKVYLFYGNAQDMYIGLRYLSDGWDNVDSEMEERVPYINIWHGKCPHITMCFRKSAIPRELTFKLYLYQYLLENDGGNFIAHVTEDNQSSLFSENGTGSNKQEIVVTLPSKRNDFRSSGNTDTSLNSSNIEPQLHFHFRTPDIRLDRVERATTHHYPHDLKVQLKVLLDPYSPFDRDWRALASALGREKCIRYIEKMDSPTESLLCDAEGRKISLETLKDIMHSIQRNDAAEVIRGFIPERDTRSRRAPTQNTDTYNITTDPI